MSKNKLVFPKINAAMTITFGHMVELDQSDLTSEEDLRTLLWRMFFYPEYDVYYHHCAGAPSNPWLTLAEQQDLLFIKERASHYFKVPHGDDTKHWQRIVKEPGRPPYNWEKRALATPRYWRLRLTLTPRMERELEERRQIAVEYERRKSGGMPRSMPSSSRKLNRWTEERTSEPPVRGWRQIFACLGDRYTRSRKDSLKKLNEKTGGPICYFGRKPEANPGELRAWMADTVSRADALQYRRKQEAATVRELQERAGIRAADHKMHFEERPNAKGKARET